MAHTEAARTEWLPCVGLKLSVLPVQYMQRIVSSSCCLIVVILERWWLKPRTLRLIPRNCWLFMFFSISVSYHQMCLKCCDWVPARLVLSCNQHDTCVLTKESTMCVCMWSVPTIIPNKMYTWCLTFCKPLILKWWSTWRQWLSTHPC